MLRIATESGCDKEGVKAKLQDILRQNLASSATSSIHPRSRKAAPSTQVELGTACLPRWLARVRHRHRSSIPYYRFDAQPGLVLDVCRHGHLPHDISMMFRSWLRLRCGLLVLSHLDGRRSAARFQLCIFCGSWIRNPMVHCLSKCPHWNSHRDGICLCLGTVESMGCQQFALQCLRSSIPSKALVSVVKWSSCIDRAEFEYWK